MDVSGSNSNDNLGADDGVTNGVDTIHGAGGDDIIHGLGGGDTIFGGTENDWLYGDGGDDKLYGGSGNDLLFGGSGADDLNGGSGSDWAMYGGSPVGVVVSLATGAGYNGYAEGDTLVLIEHLAGSAHDDYLVGNSDNNTLLGDGGHDTLKGGGGADTLWGSSGNDVLEGGASADTIDGGPGIDTAFYGGSNAGVSVNLALGTGFSGDAAFDILISIENLTGSGYDDYLYGTSADNVLDGQGGHDDLAGNGGADILWGGNGNDVLDGGPNVDTMIGGFGNDIYLVDDYSDTVTELPNQGSDTVRVSTTWMLPAGASIEMLRTTFDTGVTMINLIGNSDNNEIIGNAGNNILNGGGGNDELIGLGGQDTFLFNTLLDPAAHVDLSDFVVVDDVMQLDNSVFTSLSLGTVAGSEFATGPAALDGNDYIIYDNATGAIFYDSDGSGAAAAIQFAQVSPGLPLENFDFFVVT